MLDIIGWLGVAAALLGASATWGGLWSPRARRLKDERAVKDLRDQRVHDALFGNAELGYPGLVVDMKAVRDKLSAPLLNGKGDRLIETVDRLDKRTATQGRAIAEIKRRLTEAGK